MLKKRLVFIVMLALASVSYGVEREDEFLSLDEEFLRINTSNVTMEIIEEVYKEYEIERASIYLMTLFFDSIHDIEVKSELIEAKRRSGELDCRTNLLYRSYDMRNVTFSTEKVADDINSIFIGMKQCDVMTESEKIFIVSRILLHAYAHQGLKESVWPQLLELEDINDIDSYNLLARASYYYAMSLGGMRICLANKLGNCMVHEKWNPDLLRISNQLRDSENYYLSKLYYKFFITTAFYNADEFGVSNPYID
jgi:hypothetical protein